MQNDTASARADAFTNEGAPDASAPPAAAGISINLDRCTVEDVLTATSEAFGYTPGSRSDRDLRSRAKVFLTRAGYRENTLAKRVFDELTFRPKLNEVTEALVEQRQNPKNVRWAATGMYSTWLALQTNQELPLDFADALKCAMDAKGFSATRLIKAMESRFKTEWHGAIYAYLRRERHPRGKKGREIVRELELILETAPGELYTRAFHDPVLLKGPFATTTPYRQRQSALSRERYALKALPAQFAELWDRIVHWRSRTSHTLEDGSAHDVKRPWDSEATVAMNRKYLLRYLGYLALPRSATPAYKMTQEDRWRAGQGISAESLSFAHWFDIKLLNSYVEFRRARTWSGDITAECVDLLVAMSMLVKYEWSFVNAHPDLAPLFGQRVMAPAQWDRWVQEHVAAPLLKRLTALRRGKPPRLSRVPEEALAHVLQDDDPAYLMASAIRTFEIHSPPRVQTQHFALHQRDAAICWLLWEVPLRAKNISELQLDGIREDEAGHWWVHVDKSLLKNKHSKDAQTIARRLQPAPAAALKAWMEEGRRVLDPDGTSPYVFLVQPKKGAHKRSRDGQPLGQSALERVIWKVTERYFGVRTGPHFFRHLQATAYLRADPRDIDRAAAVLNVSHEVVRKRYAHLIQQDGLDRATEFLAEKLTKLEVMGPRRQYVTRRGVRRA